MRKNGITEFEIGEKRFQYPSGFTGGFLKVK